MNKANETYKKRIDQVIDYVNANLERSIPLEELASVACFSTFHFHRIFVAVTGESVIFFTNRLRLEKAARLLKFSKQTVADIAMDCGFSSPSTFSRAFKKYFETTPSSYRSGGKIENSKICKELFPVNDYLVPMSEEEMKTRFPVEIRELPQRRVAYIRVLDSYREGVVLEAFGDLVRWAKKVDLYDSETIFGMSVDDPMVTPKEKYRYEACITIPEKLIVKPENGLATTTLPRCKYAVAAVSGDHGLVATAISYLFNHWLINSSYEPEHQPGLEIFRDNAKVCNWDQFDLELCIPVKKLNTY